MSVLLALFVLRVVGQAIAATIAPRWLPPMARWYSGLMPYRYLLPAQMLIVALMAAVTVGVVRQFIPLGTAPRSWAAWILPASYVYAAGMAFRPFRYLRATPERRGVFIPIVFHLVLAGFVFTYGRYLVRYGR